MTHVSSTKFDHVAPTSHLGQRHTHIFGLLVGRVPFMERQKVRGLSPDHSSRGRTGNGQPMFGRA
jgi:hypothetical protein